MANRIPTNWNHKTIQGVRMKTLIAAVGLLVLSLSLYADTVSFNLLWESTTFRRANTDRAQSVSTLRHRIIVGEVLGRPDNLDTDVVIKSFNLHGRLIWTDELNDANWVRVETAGDLAVAVIQHFIPPPGGIGRVELDLVLRGYDLKTGEIRWTSHTILDSPQQLLVRNGRIAIVGYSTFTDPLTGIILVHDLATGRELWRVAEIQPYIIPLKDTIFWDVDDAGRNLIAIGTIGPGTQRDLHIRSYRFADGVLRWEQVIPQTFAAQLQVVGHDAFVAGFSSNGTGYLASFDIGSGQLLWQAVPEPSHAFSRLLVTATQVIVSGSFTFQAYDRTSHEVLWRKSLTADQGISHIFVVGNFIGAVESDSPLSGPPTTSLKLVALATGEPVVELPLSTVVVEAVAFFQNRLILVGSSPAGALVRSYGVTLP